MLLRGELIDDLRRAVRRTGNAPAVTIEAVPLSGAIELGCVWTTAAVPLRDAISAWARSHPHLEAVLRVLAGVRSTVAPFGAPTFEVQPVPLTAAELAGHEWTEHRDRFRRSLIQHAALAGPLAFAIAAAYGEMVDNVVSHAQIPERSAISAVSAFGVENGGFEFAVGDLGRGVWASLRDKKENGAIDSDRVALDAAVRRGATRRSHDRGSGFSELHKALADLQATLRFRSGSAVLTLDGRGAERHAIEAESPPLDGFQLAVWCASPRPT